jgi:release factor glutamine methyltransferase
MSNFPEEYRDGYVLFCGQKCLVDERALIPRIETEELVKYTLGILQQDLRVDTIVDIGTGSGVIPLSLGSQSSRQLTIIATDMSTDALDLS